MATQPYRQMCTREPTYHVERSEECTCSVCEAIQRDNKAWCEAAASLLSGSLNTCDSGGVK